MLARAMGMQMLKVMLTKVMLTKVRAVPNQ